MSYLEWVEDFSDKVIKIDMQHRKLIEMINQLYDDMAEKKGRAGQLAVVEKMIEYTGYHFKTEEDYMQKTNYPSYLLHKMEHDKFVQKALEIKAKLEQKGFILSIEIMNFLKEWLKNHILVTDKKYSEYFNSHGIK